MSSSNTPEPYSFISMKERWAKRLLEEGLLSPAIRNKRKLSKEVLEKGKRGSPFCSVDNRIAGKARKLEFDEPVPWIIIPDTLGPAVYEYLGFTWQASRILWRRFLKVKAEWDAMYEECWEWPGIPPILKFAIDHVKDISRPLRFREDEVDSRWWLDQLGIKPKFARVLLDPEFEEEREVYTLDELFVYILEVRWPTLEHLDDCACAWYQDFRAREGIFPRR